MWYLKIVSLITLITISKYFTHGIYAIYHYAITCTNNVICIEAYLKDGNNRFSHCAMNSLCPVKVHNALLCNIIFTPTVCKNPLVRLAHVAAFASSTYSTVLGRYVQYQGGQGWSGHEFTNNNFVFHESQNSVFDLGHMFGSEHTVWSVVELTSKKSKVKLNQASRCWLRLFTGSQINDIISSIYPQCMCTV